MTELEQLLSLFFVAVTLAAVARRVGAPYPVFLAIGGVFLAFIPGAPSIAIPPELALALFVAPILLIAAYDTSLRDLKYDWAPVTGLVVFAVGFTVAAVAWVAHLFIPSLPWAAAIALPAAFPYRDLIVLTAFFVVLGTLLIQGLTLKPLMRALNLQDGDPVGNEVIMAREHTLRAALSSLDNNTSAVADAVRRGLSVRLGNGWPDAEAGAITRSAYHELFRSALAAARQAILLMRNSGEIGDDAFHRIEEELDWLEMTGGGEGE